MEPRAQDFKKSSSSSLGTSGVFRFGNRRGLCEHCGKNHSSDQCRKVAGACFKCGEVDHLKKDCLQMREVSSSGSQTIV